MRATGCLLGFLAGGVLAAAAPLCLEILSWCAPVLSALWPLLLWSALFTAVWYAALRPFLSRPGICIPCSLLTGAQIALWIRADVFGAFLGGVLGGLLSLAARKREGIG